MSVKEAWKKKNLSTAKNNLMNYYGRDDNDNSTMAIANGDEDEVRSGGINNQLYIFILVIGL